MTEHPTRSTPWLSVTRRRRWAFVEYDFWRTDFDLDPVVTDALREVFIAAMRRSLTKARSRKTIFCSAGQTCGAVHVDVAYLDELLTDMRRLFAPECLVPLRKKWIGVE